MKEPIGWFQPAHVLYKNGRKDDAVFWFYAAQVRTRYQLAFENGDRGQLLAVMVMTLGPEINNYAMQDISRFDRILNKVLQWDKLTPNPFRERVQTEIAVKQLEIVYAEIEKMRATILADRVNIETKARAAAPEIGRLYENNERCKDGRLAPEYAVREVKEKLKREWPLVLKFVNGHKNVIGVVGVIRDIYPTPVSGRQIDKLPDVYEVSVVGNDGVVVYPIVSVTRPDGVPKFKLECVLRQAMGRGTESGAWCR